MIGFMSAERRCIVVGAGLLGLSTAWALSRRGWSVAVFEAASSVGHVGSGSKGSARIFRLGYPESHYVEMAVLAEALWRELAAATNRALLHVTGQVSFGDDAALESIATAMAAQHRMTEHLTTDDVARRFPGLEIHGPALWEPDSGVLAADKCLAALRAAGQFEVVPDCRVTSLKEDHNAVRVTTVRGNVVEADVAVNCAGALAFGLLADRPPPAVQAGPSAPQVAYFKAVDARSAAPRPVFIEWGPDMIYGLPVLGEGVHAGLYKLSHHTPGRRLDEFDPLDPNNIADDPELLAPLTDAVRRLLPGLDPDPVATERCVYDNSADQDFVIDRVGRVVVGCGTSGHGFKFGPLLGEVLADLAEGNAPSIDVTRFRLDRSGSAEGRAVAAGG
jgi:sarcosine oxidase